jgi:hypothetical protein
MGLGGGYVCVIGCLCKSYGIKKRCFYFFVWGFLFCKFSHNCMQWFSAHWTWASFGCNIFFYGITDACRAVFMSAVCF